MKILVIQLARFGDIYQTWPVLRALKRSRPDAEVTFVVREKYAEAAHCEAVDRLVVLPTKSILAPFLFQSEGEPRALEVLDQFIQNLGADFDEVINLSFSPFSSYLVDEIRSEKTVVRGYCRHSDGFLAIPDDSSAYFYAQVGVGKFNRVHLIDLFSLVADVRLEASDFSAPEKMGSGRWDRPYIVVHVGASSAMKACTSSTWLEIIKAILDKTDVDVYVVGTLSERIPELGTLGSRVTDLCGETNLTDLFPMLSSARALVACDSVLIQIANLTALPTVNISFKSVNYWETGPRVYGSRVVYFQTPATVDVDAVLTSLSNLLDGNAPLADEIAVVEPDIAAQGVRYQGKTTVEDQFRWNLIQALYLGGEIPQAERFETVVAFQRINELAALGLDQVDILENGKEKKIAISILDEVDHLLQHVALTNPDARPLVDWFLTEKLRIGPQPVHDLLASTRSIFEQLLHVAKLYSLSEELMSSLHRKDLGGATTWK